MDVIAVTTRDDFLLELGQALGGHASVNPVESVTQALAQLGNTKRLQILVIDSRDIADVRADVEAVQADAPQVHTLVFADQGAEQAVAAALKGSNVFAVLAMPVDPRQTSAVFGGAVADLKNKQVVAPRPPQKSAPIVFESEPTPAPQAAAPVAHEPIRPASSDDGASKFNPRVLGGIALAVVAALVLWFLTRGGEPRSARSTQEATPATQSKDSGAQAEPAAPAIETSLVQGKVDELLEKARLAMRERRYTEPTGDNALLYSRSAAYADPANGEALDGLSRVAAVLATRFEENLSARNHEEAAVTFAQFKSAVPKDARVAQLQAQLTKLRTEIAREQEAERQKQLAEERAAREAAAAEQKKAREAKAAAAEAERKAQLAREKEMADKLKAEQAARSAAEAQKSAPGAVSRRPATGAALQTSLKRKRYVAPEYPQDALAKGLGGVVTVSFTVDVKGEPQEIKIEKAEPADVFDRAAIAAVKRWRYEPLVIDGVPTEVPVRMAIRFAPP